MKLLKRIFKWLFERKELKKDKKVYCLHCGKEISYDKYRHQAGLCGNCAECSCMG